MTRLVSEADIALDDPSALAAALIGHMLEHDVVCETRDACTFADLGIGSGVLEPTETVLKIRVEAADLGALESLRSFISSHVLEFADEPEPAIVWRGNLTNGPTLANFREVRLKSAVDLTPRMKRLTFTGDDVARFASDEEIHVRLYFPPAGLAVPEWPRPGDDGRIVWPAEERRPAVRYYTVRRVDLDAGEIEIDFLMHEDAGPGAAFAAEAVSGALCGMAGPVGRMAPQASWTLLAGDETALPAIARMLERMPPDARGIALIEVQDATDELPLAAPSGMDLRWLHRVPAHAGETSLLLDAIRAAPIPAGEDVYAWVACEFGLAKEIRQYLRSERELARDRHQVVGYWEREPSRAA
ncbi:MAG TPA: siderophore-interacting protein [Hansschlegelia sp.]